MNNTIKIEVGSPLLRPGLSISTEVSSKYLVKAVDGIMEKVRLINSDGRSELEILQNELNRLGL